MKARLELDVDADLSDLISETATVKKPGIISGVATS